MAPPDCTMPANVGAPSIEPREKPPRAKVDLHVHVRQAHWAVKNRDLAAIRDQLGKLFALSERQSQAIYQLMVNEIPGLRRYAICLLRDRHAADDLVQETLVRAVAAVHRWQPGSNMRAWLFVIMKNVMRNDFRRPKSADIYLGSEIDNHPATAVEGNQDSRAALFDLQRGLDQLPDGFKQVVLMCGVEGLEYVEVAEILNVPVGTVRSRLSRARSMLRSQG